MLAVVAVVAVIRNACKLSAHINTLFFVALCTGAAISGVRRRDIGKALPQHCQFNFALKLRKRQRVSDLLKKSPSTFFLHPPTSQPA